MNYSEALEKYREILAEIEYRKKVNPISFFEDLPIQALFAKSLAKIKCLFGGNRSGKTEKGAEYVISKGLKKKLKIWCCAETFSDSVNIQQNKIWKLIPKNRIKYGRYNEITGFPNRKCQLDNGTLFVFKSYDQKREGFASDDVDIIWNDEEPPSDIHTEQKMRLLDRDGEMIITMTSLKGVTDLISDLYEGSTIKKQQYAPLIKKKLPRIAEKNGVEFYFLWTTENPHIAQHRVLKDVKLMTKQEITCRIYGLPINLSGKIYPMFNTDIHVIPFSHVPFKDCSFYNVLDPHDRKPWAIIWAAVHKTGTVYIFDEYPTNRNFNEMDSDDKTYDDYAKLVKEREKIIKTYGGMNYMKRIIDPNFGNKTVQLASRQGGQSKTTPVKELEKRGLRYKDGIDSLEVGHLQVRQYLHYEEDKETGEITKQPGMFITDNCENTIRHASRYSRGDIIASDGDVKDKVKVKEKYKDYCDLIRYLNMSRPRYIARKTFVAKAEKVY